MTKQTELFATEFTVFMLVRATPDSRAVSIADFRESVREQFATVLAKHRCSVSLRFFDLAFSSHRITDIWIWGSHDACAYHLLMQDLRADSRGDPYYRIVETMVGVEDNRARKYYCELLGRAE